jgi:hypothetical protein
MVFQGLYPIGWPLVIIVFWSWSLSLAAALLFVMPILAFVPRLRQPPFWLAAMWGAAAAWAFTSLFIQRRQMVDFWSPLAVAGAASGLLYALLVRRRASRASAP